MRILLNLLVVMSLPASAQSLPLGALDGHVPKRALFWSTPLPQDKSANQPGFVISFRDRTHHGPAWSRPEARHTITSLATPDQKSLSPSAALTHAPFQRVAQMPRSRFGMRTTLRAVARHEPIKAPLPWPVLPVLALLAGLALCGGRHPFQSAWHVQSGGYRIS